MPTDEVRPQRAGTPEEHLRYMLDYGLRFASGDGVAAVAEVLLLQLGAGSCPRQDADCRPGACDCDGARDALSYALRLHAEGRQIRA